jgi:hypothetical protein
MPFKIWKESYKKDKEKFKKGLIFNNMDSI